MLTKKDQRSRRAQQTRRRIRTAAQRYGRRERQMRSSGQVQTRLSGVDDRHAINRIHLIGYCELTGVLLRDRERWRQIDVAGRLPVRFGETGFFGGGNVCAENHFHDSLARAGGACARG